MWHHCDTPASFTVVEKSPYNATWPRSYWLLKAARTLGLFHDLLWSIISAKIARYGIDNTKTMSHTQRERSMPFGRRSPPFGRRFISFGRRFISFGRRFISFGRRSISFGRRSISRRSEGDIVQGSYGDLRNRHIYIYWFCHSCPETPTAFPSVFIA